MEEEWRRIVSTPDTSFNVGELDKYCDPAVGLAKVTVIEPLSAGTLTKWLVCAVR
jgi:hypothetical protein